MKQLEAMNEHVVVLYQSLIDQETGQRGYSLSKNEAFLEPFYAGTETFQQTSEKLKQDITIFPSVSKSVTALMTSGEKWNSEYGNVQIKIIEDNKLIPHEVLDNSKMAFDNIRLLYKEVTNEIRLLKSEMEERSQNRVMIILTVFCFGILLMLVLAVFYIIWHLTNLVQPIVELEQSVTSYSNKDFTVKVPEYHKDDELGRLIIGIERMRTELKEKFFTLESIAYKDGLTGINNRRTADYYLTKFIEKAPMENDLSIILIDIDHFKNFNDKYGHLEGDRVLKHIASVLEKNVKTFDVLARFGGEEFILILPKTKYPCALNVAERLRKAIEMEPLGTYQIRASFGVTTFEKGDTYTSFIHKADEALYKAKANGRNQVELKLTNIEAQNQN